MGLFAEYLPFEMLAVLVLSDTHLSDDALAAFNSALEGDDDREFKSLLFFKVGREDGEFLIEVPVDDKDWEQEMPGTYSISSSTPTTGAAAGFFSALSAA